MSDPHQAGSRPDAGPAVDAQWPERVVELAAAWHAQPDPARRERLLGEMWLLLNAAIRRYLRLHGHRYGTARPEDLEDIASDKSLDLLRRIDSEQWNPATVKPGQLCAFISTLARNGLIDHYRVHGSKRREQVDAADSAGAAAPTVLRPRVERTEYRAERARFVSAIGDCAALLSKRSRTIWFLRVLLDLPSRQIAHHPEVNMKPSAVDMALSRTRTVIRNCMSEKGFEPDDTPPGVFSALWEAFRAELPDIRPGEEDQ